MSPAGTAEGGKSNREFNDLFLRYVAGVSQFALCHHCVSSMASRILVGTEICIIAE